MTGEKVGRLTVDLDALAANLATLRGLAGSAEVAPVVKADAYGLGATQVALRLWAEGARSFFVTRAAEGEALRDLLPNAEIRVLEGCLAGGADRLIDARLKPVLNSAEQVARWSQVRGGAAALHIDTGMNRLGLRPEEAAILAEAPADLKGVELELVMSHLACASEPAHPMNARQRDAFTEAAARFPGARKSLASSAGMCLGPDYAFDLARPGIALYGGGPTGAPDPRFRPVATLELPVLQVRTVKAGETVGYGAQWPPPGTAPETRQVAILGAGYADGVLRSSFPGAYAVLNGRRCAVVGRISMDFLAIDVTDAPNVGEGDMAQLFGPDVHIDAFAAACGTLAYEVLSRLGPRLQRTYTGRPT